MTEQQPTYEVQTPPPADQPQPSDQKTVKPRRQRQQAVQGELIATAGPPEPQTPNALIAIAVENDLAIEKLEKLLQLQREWEAHQARKAFFDALSKFQSEIPPIVKTDKTDQGRAGKRRYASLGTINEAIRPWLYANGLSFRWSQHQAESGDITITCIVSHRDGHTEETSLTGPPDDSGAKNGLQQIGSAQNYLQRYTLISALGLTTVSEDTDSEPDAETKPPIVQTPEQARQAAIDLARNLAKGPLATTPPIQPLESLPPSPTPPDAKQGPPASKQQLAEIMGLCKRIFATGPEAFKFLQQAFEIQTPEHLQQISDSHATDVLIALNRMASDKTAATAAAKLARTVHGQDGTGDGAPPLAVDVSPAAVTADQRAEIRDLTMRAYGDQAVAEATGWLRSMGVSSMMSLSFDQAAKRIAALKKTLDIPF